MRTILSLFFVLFISLLSSCGGVILGISLTLGFFRILAFLTHAGLAETEFVAGFWSLWTGTIGGILGGILGLVLGIKRVRKNK